MLVSDIFYYLLFLSNVIDQAKDRVESQPTEWMMPANFNAFKVETTKQMDMHTYRHKLLHDHFRIAEIFKKPPKITKLKNIYI